jgi:hypothetical protein
MSYPATMACLSLKERNIYELPNSGTKSYFSSVSDQGLRYPRRLTPTFGTKFYISSSLSEIELYK